VSEPRVVYAWPRSMDSEVRATLTTYKGLRLADVRVYRADADDRDHPTRKGIAIRVEDLPKLLEAVQALIARSSSRRRTRRDRGSRSTARSRHGGAPRADHVQHEGRST
jgi:Transcriptional Coactivator p15 (PC4)